MDWKREKKSKKIYLSVTILSRAIISRLVTVRNFSWPILISSRSFATSTGNLRHTKLIRGVSINILHSHVCLRLEMTVILTYVCYADGNFESHLP